MKGNKNKAPKGIKLTLLNTAGNNKLNNISKIKVKDAPNKTNLYCFLSNPLLFIFLIISKLMPLKIKPAVVIIKSNIPGPRSATETFPMLLSLLIPTNTSGVKVKIETTATKGNNKYLYFLLNTIVSLGNI
ncbi:MAG TPA: hypothetical protein VJK01_00065 [Candidatus Paceibacterota bacterium]